MIYYKIIFDNDIESLQEKVNALIRTDTLWKPVGTFMESGYYHQVMYRDPVATRSNMIAKTMPEYGKAEKA